MLRKEATKKKENQILLQHLSKGELGTYFSNLPRDLTIVVNDKEYSFNIFLISSQSTFFKKLINEHNSRNDSQVIKIEINDQNYVFPSIASFLNGKEISITTKNILSINESAHYFEISSLIGKIQNIINSSSTLENICSTLLCLYPNIPDDKFQFLLDHVNQINEEDIFQLPPALLLRVIKSNDAKFESSHSRYEFLLKCFLTYPENSEISENIKGISFDNFKQILESNFLDQSKLSITSLKQLHLLSIELQSQINCANIETLLCKSMINEEEKLRDNNETNIKTIQDKLNLNNDNINIYNPEIQEIYEKLINLKNELNKIVIINDEVINGVNERIDDLFSRNIKLKELAEAKNAPTLHELYDNLNNALNDIKATIHIKTNYNQLNLLMEKVNEIEEYFNILKNIDC